MVSKAGTFHGIEPEVETEYHTRASLEAEVANALAVSGGIDASDIQVRANEDEIKLDGTVGTTEEIERATVIAQSVEGVRAVKNQISLGERGIG